MDKKSITSIDVPVSDAESINKIIEYVKSNKENLDQILSLIDVHQMGPEGRGITFQPIPGQILACNFNTGFRKPEIVKLRPVMVISPSPRFKSGLCLVVAISSAAPKHKRPVHIKLPDGIIHQRKYKEAWLKCDVIHQVACHRLDRLRAHRGQFEAPVVENDVLMEVRRCVLHAIGLDHLTEHLK